MANWNRREFIQASLAACFLETLKLEAAPASRAEITHKGGTVQARGKDYTWEWSQEKDEFRLLDQRGLLIAGGQLQPAVLVQPEGKGHARRCTSGMPVGFYLHDDIVSVQYEGVNGSAQLAVNWRFDDEGMWLEPIRYETPVAENVVSLHYFAQGMGEGPRPSLTSDYVVLPGMNTTSALSPVIPVLTFGAGVEMNWLGHSMIADPAVQIAQGWGMPVYYFCGFHYSPYDHELTPTVKLEGAKTKDLLNAFCCGLAEIPAGDLLIETNINGYSPIVSYRGDLWGHVAGPASLSLGARLYWTVGPNYYEAIRRYYLGLLGHGIIRKKTNSPHKNEVALAPSFCTYGEQLARQRANELLDEATLNAIYDGLKRSGMKTKLFVIDAKWEGKWGNLRHSPERLPHFEETLNRIRADGHYIGLWAAFLRCGDPAELGLTPKHMLRQPDGHPYVGQDWTTSGNFYIYDLSQREVREALGKQAKAFTRRYKPDFVKFDFGYQIPSLAFAAPADMTWAGERFLAKSLDVIVGAMREENPDLVVLYYSLSPLLSDNIDLHSPDDLYLCTGDYDLEANRRYFFSSLLGEIGMPTWGSSGYDWQTAPENWFDSAALGTVGNLISFSGAQAELLAKPERIAKFNGLTQVLRPANTFSIIPVDEDYFGAERGAHSSSWARIENGEVVLVALRERRLDGRKGSGRFRDLVSTDTSVVVASKTNQGIASASKLALVPYGDGQITLTCHAPESAVAEATEHYFGGGSKIYPLSHENGRLRIPLRERAADGPVIEWIEVNVRG